jgi:hypothetical protein
MTSTLILAYSSLILAIMLFAIAWGPVLIEKFLVWRFKATTRPIRKTEVARELPRDWIA